MTKESKAPVKAKVNWTKVQLIGLWSTIILGATFWGGVTVGTQATLNSQAETAKIKALAVEEFKATTPAPVSK